MILVKCRNSKISMFQQKEVRLILIVEVNICLSKLTEELMVFICSKIQLLLCQQASRELQESQATVLNLKKDPILIACPE